MDTYKVTDPNGITVNGSHVKKGDTTAIAKGAELNAMIHFHQVEAVKPKPEDAKSDAKK